LYADAVTTTQHSRARARNLRGQGAKLKTDIVAAAGRLLDETGNPDAVTLRAVAREVGVAAPSIYAHFPDREAILQAVIDEGFLQLQTDIEAARAARTGPVDKIMAGLRAFLHFARARPARYAVMLGRPGSLDLQPEPSRGIDDPATFAYRSLVTAIEDCVRDGRSVSSDPHRDATALLVAIHGYALLRPTRPTFPWPPEEELVTYLITTLAGITPSETQDAPR
jgi:AcrR family transcriptional regulator